MSGMRSIQPEVKSGLPAPSPEYQGGKAPNAPDPGSGLDSRDFFPIDFDPNKNYLRELKNEATNSVPRGCERHAGIDLPR